jgi:hypothetical protein
VTTGFRRIFKAGAIFGAGLLVLTGCIQVGVPLERSGGSESSGSVIEDSSAAETRSPEPAESSEPAETRSPEPEPSETSSASPSPTATQSQQVASQNISFSVDGGCESSREIFGYYGIFEDYDDDCYIRVRVTPSTPRRTVELQYRDADGNWTVEDTADTNSSGVATVYVDVTCEGNTWCDGDWDYRVNVKSRGDLPSEKSRTWSFKFLPAGSDF